MRRGIGLEHPDPSRGTGALAWLHSLHNAILRTRVTVGGAPVPLQLGLAALRDRLADLRGRGGRLWWAANGGSAALASHLSQDLLMRCGVFSSVLSDAALLTCVANDYGYDQVYARPLKMLMREGDLLIAVSSSGNSVNILKAVEVARSGGVEVVAFSAFDEGNRLNHVPTAISFHLPSHCYGHAEVGHEALVHAVIESLAEASRSAEAQLEEL
jgi:D-sedoheptulose 7-phosphate isomerase